MAEQLTSKQLLEIANEFGTPLYVYHGDKILEQYAKLKNAFSAFNTKFFYACKALTNVNVIKLIHEAGAGIDCSSINEVKLALFAGVPPHDILYTSNGISFQEIVEAKELGVIINIDSISNLEKFAVEFGDSYPVGVRLRPNIMAGGNFKISTGHEKSKFGIPIEKLNQIHALVDKYHLKITNLHIHTGSDIGDADVFLKGINVLFEIISDFPDLKSIDLGGGFKVSYKETDAAIDLHLLSEKIIGSFQNHPVAKNMEIWFEPGKFLVSECGYFIAEVTVIKETPSVTFASVNTGFNHLIRPMFYDAFHYIDNISNPSGLAKEFSVVGYICETDTFAWKRNINEIREGDLLAFRNAGAYGFEMSSNYNSRFKPAEVLVQNGKARLIRRREDFQYLIKNQIY